MPGPISPARPRGSLRYSAAMPVPLPRAQDVISQRPDAAEAQSLTDAVASVVAGRDGLLPIQRRLVVALFGAMTEHPVTLEGRPVLTVQQAVATMARRDLQFRARMVQVMLLCALVRRPIPEDVVIGIARAADELGVHDGMVDVAQEFAAGSLGLAAVDFTRNGYEGGWNAAEAAAVVHASHQLDSTWAFCEDDEEMAAQWAIPRAPGAGRTRPEGLGDVPGPWLRLPRHSGLGPTVLTQHDWVHVLADYGTTVESEVEVFGLIARANDDLHAFSLLAMVISLFETGYLETGAGLFERLRRTLLVQPAHGGATGRRHVPRRRLPRYRDRSEQCRFPEDGLVRGRRPHCADLRTRFNLVPKSVAAQAAGTVGPWEPGGISPFQLAAGQALAAALGLPYDAHGASA